MSDSLLSHLTHVSATPSGPSGSDQDDVRSSTNVFPRNLLSNESIRVSGPMTQNTDTLHISTALFPGPCPSSLGVVTSSGQSELFSQSQKAHGSGVSAISEPDAAQGGHSLRSYYSGVASPQGSHYASSANTIDLPSASPVADLSSVVDDSSFSGSMPATPQGRPLPSPNAPRSSESAQRDARSNGGHQETREGPNEAAIPPVALPAAPGHILITVNGELCRVPIPAPTQRAQRDYYVHLDEVSSSPDARSNSTRSANGRPPPLPPLSAWVWPLAIFGGATGSVLQNDCEPHPDSDDGIRTITAKSITPLSGAAPCTYLLRDVTSLRCGLHMEGLKAAYSTTGTGPLTIEQGDRRSESPGRLSKRKSKRRRSPSPVVSDTKPSHSDLALPSDLSNVVVTITGDRPEDIIAIRSGGAPFLLLPDPMTGLVRVEHGHWYETVRFVGEHLTLSGMFLPYNYNQRILGGGLADPRPVHNPLMPPHLHATAPTCSLRGTATVTPATAATAMELNSTRGSVVAGERASIEMQSGIPVSRIINTGGAAGVYSRNMPFASMFNARLLAADSSRNLATPPGCYSAPADISAYLNGLARYIRERAGDGVPIAVLRLNWDSMPLEKKRQYIQ